MFKWKVMPFGVANAPALFKELMDKNLYILRRRPLVRKFYNDFNTMFLFCLSCCLLLV